MPHSVHEQLSQRTFPHPADVAPFTHVVALRVASNANAAVILIDIGCMAPVLQARPAVCQHSVR